MSTDQPSPVGPTHLAAAPPAVHQNVHTELDIHQIEEVLQPVPEEVRTTRVSGQFWIWAGANIAPINWVLGALGIGLGPRPARHPHRAVAGNLIGMALFGLFVLIGQRTGVTGMVLSRAAFGRRGAYLPAAIQACLPSAGARSTPGSSSTWSWPCWARSASSTRTRRTWRRRSPSPR